MLSRLLIVLLIVLSCLSVMCNDDFEKFSTSEYAGVTIQTVTPIIAVSPVDETSWYTIIFGEAIFMTLDDMVPYDSARSEPTLIGFILVGLCVLAVMLYAWHRRRRAQKSEIIAV